MRTAIGLWVRNEVARRWRALIALGVLAGLAGGLALAAVAGARRTSTAYERFREATGRSDAVVFGTLIGVLDADYGPGRRMPEVEDAGAFTLAPITLKGIEAGQLAPNDERLYRTINRPLLVAGVRVVGIGLLPQTPHFSFDQGAWVSDEGFNSLAPPGDGEAPRARTVLVRFAKGSSLEKGGAGLEERFGHMFDVEGAPSLRTSSTYATSAPSRGRLPRSWSASASAPSATS